MSAFARPALAQTAPAETPSPTTYTDTVQGVEFSAGTIADDTRLGASFAGEATGDLPGFLVASIDYTPSSPGPGVTNNIVGGGWTLLGNRSTILGSFTGGTVQWNEDGTLADVVADMSVLGGSVDGIPVSSGGTGAFGGVLDQASNPRTSTDDRRRAAVDLVAQAEEPGLTASVLFVTKLPGDDLGISVNRGNPPPAAQRHWFGCWEQ